MRFKIKKYRDSEEEVMEYFFGKDFVKEQKHNSRWWVVLLKKAESDEAEESEAKRVRKMTLVILSVWLVLMLSTTSLLLFPKTLYYMGIIKKPVQLQTFSSIGNQDIVVKLDSKTSPEWQNTNFVQQVNYSITNKSAKFAYVKVKVKILTGANKQTGLMNFLPIKEVLSPGEKIEGNFQWDRTKTDSANKVYFIWESVFKDDNILEDLNPKDKGKNSEEDPAKIGDIIKQ